MRCPKCANSFLVEQPVPAAPPAGQMQPMTAAAAAPRVNRPVNPFKQTMIGVAGPAGMVTSAVPAQPGAGEKAVPPRVAPAPVRPRTVETPAASDADLPAPAPRAAERPVPRREKPTMQDVPAVKPPPPRRTAVAAPPEPERSPTSDSELPAALAFGLKKTPARAAPPAAQPQKPPEQVAVPPKAPSDDLFLPELVKEPPLVKPVSLRPLSTPSDLPSLPGAPLRADEGSTQPLEIEISRPSSLEIRPNHNKKAQPADDLEIDLPSPALDGAESVRPAKLDFDLDLPSPSDLPAASTNKVAGRGVTRSADNSLEFGQIDLGTEPDASESVAQAAAHIALIPDLDAQSLPPAASRTSAAPSLGIELPDLTDALPLDSNPPLASEHSGKKSVDVGPVAAISPNAVPLEAPLIARSPNPNPVSRQSGGGGTDFGEVALDIGSAVASAIGTMDEEVSPRPRLSSADLEFGGIPQQSKGPAAPEGAPGAPAAQDSPGPVRVSAGAAINPPRLSRSRHGVRHAVLAGTVLVVVAGASLSLMPDVGLFGVSYIADRLRKPTYERLLHEQSAAVNRALASDRYADATAALQRLDAVQRANPRAKSLKAYLAFVSYEIDLRFGSAPERSSRAKVLLSALDGAEIEWLELAQAARAAAERNLTRAHQRVDESRRGDQRSLGVLVLSAQIETLDRRPGQALTYWREVERQEQSARSAFGRAATELALGQIDASEQSARTAIARQPRHAGARLLLARVAIDKRGDEQTADKFVRDVIDNPADSSPAEQVQAFSLLGDLSLLKSRVSAAEAAYTKALAGDPHCSAALRGLGEALYRSGRFSEALARFEAAVQADPDDSTAAVGVAKSQLSLERVREAVALLSKLLTSHGQSFLVNYWYGAALEAMGNREDAEKAFATAVQLGGSEPQTIDAYIALALLKNQQGRREEAQKLLETAQSRLPMSAKLIGAVGQLALSEGRYDAAIADFRRALELDANDITSRFRLAVALRKQRQFDDALAAFDDVAKVDAQYPGLALERGLLFESSGRTDEALKAFEDALAKAPSDPDLMLRVGCGKVAAGRPKEAADLLRKVLDQRPTSAETHHCLGRAQLLEGNNLALALRTLERAAELDPFRPEYFLYVGWAANEAGRISVAEQALKKALSLDQGLGDAYWQRGVLRFRQGAVKDAVADLTKAIELRPSRSEAHAALAEAYYELGSEPKAMEHWRIAVQAQPDNAAWHYSFGKLLQASGRDGDARVELEKALSLGAQLDPPPRWIWEAHRLLARSLGMQPTAIPHWQEYLRLSPLDNAYRDEAKQTLARLGQPWTDG